jgi:hypothetical protein
MNVWVNDFTGRQIFVASGHPVHGLPQKCQLFFTRNEFVVVGDADVLALLHRLDVLRVRRVRAYAVLVHLSRGVNVTIIKKVFAENIGRKNGQFLTHILLFTPKSDLQTFSFFWPKIGKKTIIALTNFNPPIPNIES